MPPSSTAAAATTTLPPAAGSAPAQVPLLRRRPDPAPAADEPSQGHHGSGGDPQVRVRHDLHDPAEEPEQRSSQEWNQTGALQTHQQRGQGS